MRVEKYLVCCDQKSWIDSIDDYFYHCQILDILDTHEAAQEVAKNYPAYKDRPGRTEYYENIYIKKVYVQE